MISHKLYQSAPILEQQTVLAHFCLKPRNHTSLLCGSTIKLTSTRQPRWGHDVPEIHTVSRNGLQHHVICGTALLPAWACSNNVTLLVWLCLCAHCGSVKALEMSKEATAGQAVHRVNDQDASALPAILLNG